MAKVVGFGFAVAGAAAGIVCAAILYLVIVGLGSLVGGDLGEERSLMTRAWTFGITFGLLSAAHWTLGIGRRWLAHDPGAMLSVNVLALAMAALGIILALTGDRWQSMIEGVHGGAMLLLVIAWMALTHFVSKVVERRAPAGTPAGAA